VTIILTSGKEIQARRTWIDYWLYDGFFFLSFHLLDGRRVAIKRSQIEQMIWGVK
jgi:hypothetical protein